MTAKEFLIKFCELKAHCIKEKTKCDLYFTEEDKKDILNWTSKKCKKVTNKILEYTKREDIKNLHDSYLCLWCLLLNSSCNICTYGKRHDICDDYYSDYNIITRNNTIAEMIDVNKLKKLTKQYCEDNNIKL